MKKIQKIKTTLRNKITTIGDALYYNALKNELRDCKTVLDLGCGASSPLKNVIGNFRSEGVDAYLESIKRSKKEKIHDSYQNLNLKEIAKHYKAGSFDAVVLLDVLEHVTEKEGYKLMKDMEKIANKKVIILTPNGFFHQHALEGNPYQIHKSGWSVKNFLEHGYKVYGLRGLKFLRSEHAEVKIKPWILGGVLIYITERLFFYIPKLSFDLLAIKYVKREN